MPHAHLAIPTIDVQDVLSVDIGFTALPYSTTESAYTLEETNELNVTYMPDES